VSTTATEGWRELAAPCADPECLDSNGRRSLAEPEADGNHRYFACPECGFTFGWQRAQPVAVNSEGSCAVGVPEALRRNASAAMHAAISGAAERPKLPLLQIGRRPDAHPA